LITIKPFKALRPKKELYSSIVSLPYDVQTYNEVKAEIVKNNLSLYKIIRSEVEFDDHVDQYSNQVYLKAKTNFLNYISKEYLVQDQEPYFYVYKLIKENYQQVGFVGLTSALDYENGLIKKHEKTRPDKENDRIRHIETINAQTGLVFLTYRSDDFLNKILLDIQQSPPEVNFITDDNVNHIFWVVKNAEIINKIIEGFKNIPSLYISDGHHRAAAAYSVAKKYNPDLGKSSIEKESDYIMSIIFPHDSLNILPYNRAVRDLNGKTSAEFMQKLKENFIIETISPNEKDGGFCPKFQKQIGMYLNNQWYLLKGKENIIKSNDIIASLDVSILQDFILGPILGIENPRTDKRIEFIGGIRGTSILKQMVDSKEFTVTFSMFPTTIEQLMSVADTGKQMPPKSTWFEPKPRSGMAIHLLD
jgi:uncharacterized protein (DUF1015 family)